MASIRDDFPGTNRSIMAPSDSWAVITPHNTNKLVAVPKWITIAATSTNDTGEIVCVDKNGVEVTFYVQRGQFLPIRPHIIKSTGTTGGLVIIAGY
jgi:hypothetical protein